MKLARYWSRQSAEAADRNGRRVRAAARGWSNDNIEAATAMALAIAQRVAQILAGGQTKLARYPYGDRPIPEPVTREFVDASGVRAVITRNIYGAFVLNARDLMFVDVDVEPAPDQSVRRVMSGLLSIFGQKAEPATQQDPAEDAIRRAAEQRGLPIRLYKTAGGYRAIVTNGSYEAAADRTQALLREFGSDPLYIRLCVRQESFRARLSPKPWRIGMRPPAVSFPFETAAFKRALKIGRRNTNPQPASSRRAGSSANSARPISPRDSQS